MFGVQKFHEFVQRAATTADWHDWQWQLRHAIREPEIIIELLALDAAAATELRQAAERYPLQITPYYLSLAGQPQMTDPILRQCIPDIAELLEGGSADPLAEEVQSPTPGLIHRYPDRLLLVLNHHCAVRCRHCLRKRLWSEPPSEHPSEVRIAQLRAYLKTQPQVREIIISGGDPLLLPEKRLQQWLRALAGMPQIEVLRVASRLPVVLPQRLTPQFCQTLTEFPATWLVTHFNHPSELTTAATIACQNVARAGIPILNQTVLLRGVNDDAETLRQLFTGLLRMKVKPYYLFHADPVAGTSHFRTGLRKGLEIIDALHGNVSGMAIPTFAFDLPDGGGKVRLLPQNVKPGARNGVWQCINYRGQQFEYVDRTRVAEQ